MKYKSFLISFNIFTTFKFNSTINNNSVIKELETLTNEIQNRERIFNSYNNIYSKLSYFLHNNFTDKNQYYKLLTERNEKTKDDYLNNILCILKKLIQNYNKYLMVLSEYHTNDIENKNYYILEITNKLLEKYNLLYFLKRNEKNENYINLNKNISSITTIKNKEEYIIKIKNINNIIVDLLDEFNDLNCLLEKIIQISENKKSINIPIINEYKAQKKKNNDYIEDLENKRITFEKIYENINNK